MLLLLLNYIIILFIIMKHDTCVKIRIVFDSKYVLCTSMSTVIYTYVLNKSTIKKKIKNTPRGRAHDHVVQLAKLITS